jgi:hypothetical protein
MGGYKKRLSTKQKAPLSLSLSPSFLLLVTSHILHDDIHCRVASKREKGLTEREQLFGRNSFAFFLLL